MSAQSYLLRDSATMLRRDLVHTLRFPLMLVASVVTPVVLLLIFVGVFGGALESSLPGGGDYVDYLTPAILMMTVGFGCTTTAVTVNMDITEGFVARLRTMAIARSSVLAGHVLGNVTRTMTSIVLVLGVALLLGFRPDAGPLEWLAALGLIVLLALALAWLAVALGLMAKSPAGANGSTLLIQFAPFVSSALAPTDSMPAGVRWFAENQPFTPVIDTLRALLGGAPVGADGAIAVAWCAGIGLAGYLWARAVFARDPVR